MNEPSENINTVVLQHSTKPDRPRVSVAVGAKQLVRRQLQSGAALDLTTVLKERSHAASDKSFVLDLAYEEYCLRAEQGDPPDVNQFARRFPEYEASIIRLLEIHRLLSYAETQPKEALDWPLAGECLLGFQLLEELGRGGFARVYLAQEQELDHRYVVVKVSEQGVDEAQILARLSHPHIVPIHSIRSDPARGITLICMPFLGRRTFWDVLHRVKTQGVPHSAAELHDLLQPEESERGNSHFERPAALPGSYVEFVVRAGVALAEALACAHERGVCHGDMKPSNILLTPAGEPMLLDFNLAVKGPSAACGGGTLPYMAPEQLTAVLSTAQQTAITPQTDVFSLGIVLYELLTGVEPFGPLPSLSSRAEICDALLERRRAGPRPIRDFNADVDPELEEIVLHCLTFSPDERPLTARELAASLSRNLRFTKRAGRWLSGHRRLVQVACALVFAAGVLLAYAAYRREPFPLRMLHQAQTEFLAGEPRAAAATVQRAIDADPRLPEAWVLLARAHQQMGDFPAAIQDYQAAYDLTGSADFRAAQGYCNQQIGRHKEAIALFNEAQQLGEDSAEVWNDLGYSHLQDANHAEAIRCLTQAIARNSQLQAARHNRALALINQALNSGQALSEDARVDIDTALAVGPPSAELYQDAAVLYRLREMHGTPGSGEAQDFLAKGLQLGLSRQACQGNPLLADLLPPKSESETPPVGSHTLPAVRIIDPLAAAPPAHVAEASPRR